MKNGHVAGKQRHFNVIGCIQGLSYVNKCPVEAAAGREKMSRQCTFPGESPWLPTVRSRNFCGETKGNMSYGREANSSGEVPGLHRHPVAPPHPPQSPTRPLCTLALARSGYAMNTIEGGGHLFLFRAAPSHCCPTEHTYSVSTGFLYRCVLPLKKKRILERGERHHLLR